MYGIAVLYIVDWYTYRDLSAVTVCYFYDVCECVVHTSSLVVELVTASAFYSTHNCCASFVFFVFFVQIVINLFHHL